MNEFGYLGSRNSATNRKINKPRESVSREKRTETKGSGNFLETQSAMHDLLETKNEAIEDAGKRLASYLTYVNKNSSENMKTLNNQIYSLISGYAAEEREEILRNALCRLVINL